MNILILGNQAFQRKIYHSLKKEILKLKLRLRENLNLKIIFFIIVIKSTSIKLNQIVYISLINSEHFKWAYYCLIKNKNVLIDKPFTINFKQTQKLINLARKKVIFVRSYCFSKTPTI